VDRRWISIRETSTYLGIHEVTCRRLVDRGQIPAAKVGGSIRVDLKALEKQMETQQIRKSG